MTIATERPAERKLLSFDEFVAWYPAHATDRYELRRGVILEMPKPRGEHSKVAGN